MHYYILNGTKPTRIKDAQAWAKWFKENPHSRTIAQNTVNNHLVNTVFTGIDFEHAQGDKRRKPYLFESYVWEHGAGKPSYTEKYKTYEKAVAGHTLMIRNLEAPPESPPEPSEKKWIADIKSWKAKKESGV